MFLSLIRLLRDLLVDLLKALLALLGEDPQPAPPPPRRPQVIRDPNARRPRFRGR